MKGEELSGALFLIKLFTNSVHLQPLLISELL